MSIKTYSTMYSKHGLCTISEEEEVDGGVQEPSTEKTDFDLEGESSPDNARRGSILGGNGQETDSGECEGAVWTGQTFRRAWQDTRLTFRGREPEGSRELGSKVCSFPQRH